MESFRKKEIGLVVTTTVYSFLFFLAIAVFIDDAIQNIGVAILLLLAGILWAAIISPSLALAKSWFAIIGLIAIPALIVIIVGLGKTGSIVAALLLAALCIGARYAFIWEFDNNIRYSPYRIYPRGTKIVIYAAVVATIGISFSTTSELIDTDSIKVENDQISAFIEPLKPIIERIVNQVQGSIPFLTQQIQTNSLDQIIDQTLAQELAKYPPGTISPAQEEDIRRQIEEAVSSQQTEIVAEPNSIINQFITPEFITPIVTNFINQQIKNVSESYPILFPLLIIAVVFLALRVLMPVFTGLSILAITLIVFISIKLNLVKLSRSQAEVEKIEL